LEDVLAESHDAGDSAKFLTSKELMVKEPSLNDQALGAVMIPGEIVVDPWLFSISFAVQARRNGCDIRTSASADAKRVTFNGEDWIIPVQFSGDQWENLRAKSIVCATGAWAPDWESHLLKEHGQSILKNKLEGAPRRGQYRIYQTGNSVDLRHPIQPIPTQRTKGIFVFPSLYNQIVVGPTAVDQSSRTDRSIDGDVSDMLDAYAKKVIPSLDPKRDAAGEYVGIRPGTNKRDYQIHTHFAPPFIIVAGIRSTGLTASLGIGRHITHLLGQIFRQRGMERYPLVDPALPKLPPLASLMEEFKHRNDDKVTIDGQLYKVTHPLTLFGWKHSTGLPPGQTESFQ
jgi:glycerol-3-phosphate dehydrogenase